MTHTVLSISAVLFSVAEIGFAYFSPAGSQNIAPHQIKARALSSIGICREECVTCRHTTKCLTEAKLSLEQQLRKISNGS